MTAATVPRRRAVRYAHYPSIPAFRIDAEMERRANEIISKKSYASTSDASRDIFMHGIRAIEVLSMPESTAEEALEKIKSPYTQESLTQYADAESIRDLRRFRDLLDDYISVRIDRRQEEPIRYDGRGRRKA